MTKRTAIQWTNEMLATLAGMKRAGITTKAIATRLGISTASVQKKACELHAHRRLDGHSGGFSPPAGRLSGQGYLIAVDMETEE